MPIQYCSMDQKHREQLMQLLFNLKHLLTGACKEW